MKTNGPNALDYMMFIVVMLPICWLIAQAINP